MPGAPPPSTGDPPSHAIRSGLVTAIRLTLASVLCRGPGTGASENACDVSRDSAPESRHGEALGILHGARRIEGKLVDVRDRAGKRVDVIEDGEPACLAIDHRL